MRRSSADYQVAMYTDRKQVHAHLDIGLRHRFMDLSWRTTGWADLGEGDRPEDFDILVLVHAGGELVNFVGLQIISIRSDLTIIFGRFGATHPSHQGRGVLSRAIMALASDLSWVRRLSGEIYHTSRTQNPIIYEAARHVTSGLAIVDAFYPQINDAGELVPVTNAVEDLAKEISAVVSPGYLFDAQTFALRGVFAKYMRSDDEVRPRSHNAKVNGYFDRVLDYPRGDALMILSRVNLAPLSTG